MKIVIVEDAVYIRYRLIKQLSELPQAEIVGETGNYFEALELISKKHPDILILDLHLENGNGTDILSAVKDSNPELKTVVLTNYPFPQYQRKCMSLGAAYFLDKSRDFEKLPGIVAKLANA